MAFNNVPANGWPQIKQLEELDAIAKQIDNIPTFTSNDKAFLTDLPAYPDTDGSKVLTATTFSGETNLSYEEIPNELPEDPATDGTKVLTATTTSGETVLSWEDPASGGVNYSTTEQNTGLKWIDGKNIYQKTIDCGTLPNNSSITVNTPTIDTLVDIKGLIISTIEPTSQRIIPFVGGGTNDIRVDMTDGVVAIKTFSDWTLYTAYLTLWYTKPTT